jgi:hypothetical protein
MQMSDEPGVEERKEGRKEERKKVRTDSLRREEEERRDLPMTIAVGLLVASGDAFSSIGVASMMIVVVGAKEELTKPRRFRPKSLDGHPLSPLPHAREAIRHASVPIYIDPTPS